jgi:RNA ligase (TIGR02306 family)
MQRKLVRIDRIDNILPALNSDFLELAIVGGWQSVIRKEDNYKKGDLVVYFEVDSILPIAPWSKFLHDKGKSTLYTERFRGNLSQGLILPLSILPSDCKIEEGLDVTEILGVKKYERPDPVDPSLIKGRFPSYLHKIDEIRLQSTMGCLNELKGKPYYISIKCDGMSTTAYYDIYTGEFEIAAREGIRVDRDDSPYHIAVKQQDIKNKLANHKHLAYQGECCGKGIYGNHLGINGYDVFAFNLYNMNTWSFLDFNEFRDTTNELGIQTVPILEVGDSFDYTLDELLILANRVYEGTKNQIEGIVIRPQVECWSDTLKGRLSFKVLNNSYKE